MTISIIPASIVPTHLCNLASERGSFWKCEADTSLWMVDAWVITVIIQAFAWNEAERWVVYAANTSFRLSGRIEN